MRVSGAGMVNRPRSQIPTTVSPKVSRSLLSARVFPTRGVPKAGDWTMTSS
ncbi:MAG: hypothetical protein BWX71_02553 [Deltaproteobacteria bacterium ADurb.Bin072]|nr:MAG: hypothetical protein BWX71_02553 [Deltaproteobacteria bacterium ADurb.Bin072]